MIKTSFFYVSTYVMLMKKYLAFFVEVTMMKKIISIVLIMALVVIMVVTFVKNQIEKNNALSKEELGLEVGIEKGQYAPDFTLTTLDGEELTLSDLKGKKVVLNFWATWCPPCKKEMPHLQKYYENNAKKDNVEIVAVNLTYYNQTIEQVKEFVKSYNITFPIPLMEDSSISEQYEVVSIPSTFFIDTTGKIQHHIIGPVDEKLLGEYISKLD